MAWTMEEVRLACARPPRVPGEAPVRGAVYGVCGWGEGCECRAAELRGRLAKPGRGKGAAAAEEISRELEEKAAAAEEEEEEEKDAAGTRMLLLGLSASLCLVLEMRYP